MNTMRRWRSTAAHGAGDAVYPELCRESATLSPPSSAESNEAGAGAAVFLALCDTEGNVATSPTSLEIALSMAATGATLYSSTFEELRNVLGHAGTEEDEHARLKETFELLLGGRGSSQACRGNMLRQRLKSMECQ